MNTIKLFFALTILTINSVTFGMDHAADNYHFAKAACARLLRREYKEIFTTGGILLATSITTGVGLRVALDAYKSGKDFMHRRIWGPTNEDKILEIEFAKNKQNQQEKEVALKNAKLEIEKDELKFYMSIMQKRIEESSDAEEQKKLKQTQKQTIAEFSEMMRSRILNHNRMIAQAS